MRTKRLQGWNIQGSILKLSRLLPLWTRPKCDGLLHILGWKMRIKKFQGWKKRMKKFQGWDIQRTNSEAKSTFAIVDTTQMWWSTSRFHDQYKNENCCYHLGERKKWFTVCSAPRAVYEFAIQVRFFFIEEKYLQWFYHNRRYSSTFLLRLSSNNIEIKIR